jgi:hypothetical protein
LKIALLGLCQVVGMGQALQAMLPQAAVHAYHVTEHNQDVDEFIDNIVDFDLVITQLLQSHNLPGLTVDELRARGIRNLQLIPPIVFGGFHPDAFIIINGTTQLDSPIESFHSRILAGSFILNLSLSRALLLFNKLTYARLGYLNTYGVAREEFMTYMRGYGFGDLVDTAWDSWLAPGPFMYTSLHPAVRVLSAFSAEAAKRAGLVAIDAAAPEGVDDVLALQHSWPVYPGLAEAIGVPGELVFRTYSSAAGSDSERNLGLEEFGARSFDIFSQNEAVLVSDPVAQQTAKAMGRFLR